MFKYGKQVALFQDGTRNVCKPKRRLGDGGKKIHYKKLDKCLLIAIFATDKSEEIGHLGVDYASCRDKFAQKRTALSRI